MVIDCRVCGGQFEACGSRGRTPSFCSSPCRQKAYRRRKSAQRGLVTMVGDRWVRAVGKRPVMPDGSPASSTNPATWSSFKSVQSGAGDGFGLMLGGGLGCYDLDHVIEDEVVEPWVRGFIETIPERVLFMETSMSGTGIHIFIEAEEARGSRRGQIEKYSKSRFIRMTFKEFFL